MLNYRRPFLKLYILRYNSGIYDNLKISIVVQFNKYFSNVYFSGTVLAARNAEIVITSCNSQELPRVALFCFTMSDPLLGALYITSYNISFHFFHYPMRYSYPHFTNQEKEAQKG